VTGAAAPDWRCARCGFVEDAASRYCRRCGEARAAGVRAALDRWYRSLRALVLQPGRLTVEHAGSHRRDWVAPLQLFLAINVVFFVAQSLSGLSVVSIPLRAHVEGQRYSEAAREFVEQRIAARGLGRQRWVDDFELRQEGLAKATVVAIAPVLAAASALLQLRRRKPLALHFVFALHFLAFTLVFLALLFPLLGLLVRALHDLASRLGTAQLDNMVTALELAVLGGYAFVAGTRAFGGAWLARLATTAGYVAALYVALLLHRAAIFFVTAWLA